MSPLRRWLPLLRTRLPPPCSTSSLTSTSGPLRSGFPTTGLGSASSSGLPTSFLSSLVATREYLRKIWRNGTYPGKAVMDGRQGFKLRYPLALWNASLALFSKIFNFDWQNSHIAKGSTVTLSKWSKRSFKKDSRKCAFVISRCFSYLFMVWDYEIDL